VKSGVVCCLALVSEHRLTRDTVYLECLEVAEHTIQLLGMIQLVETLYYVKEAFEGTKSSLTV